MKLDLIVFQFLLGFISSGCTQTAPYLTNIISRQINASINYELDKNAYRYVPTRDTTIDYGTFDFIIIGAGATGSVVARRLAELKRWNVLVLEAGGFSNDLTDIPNVLLSLHFSPYNWGYYSTRQTTSCLDMPGQRCYIHRGKATGGSSIFNGLVYMRGSSVNYDRWGEQSPGWSYDDVLPFFKKSENFVKNDPEAPFDYDYHGRGGPLNVEYRKPRHPLVDTWLQANRERGYDVRDLNGESAVGADVAQLMIKYGKRQDSGTAYLKPIQTNPYLNISINSYVTKILIDPYTRKALGVKFSRGRQYFVARASKEVILSAGAIASPQILMLSGVGPTDHLSAMKIPTIQHLEVGTTLRDHACFRGLYFDADFPRNNKPVSEYVREYLKGQGTLTVPNENDAVGYYQTKFSPGSNDPDVELVFLPIDGFYKYMQERLQAAKLKLWTNLQQLRGIGVNVVLQKAKSVGTIRLKSNNPFDYPVINTNYLSDPKRTDLLTMYEGIKIALSLLSAPAFEQLNTTLFRQNVPECDQYPYLSRQYWLCVIPFFTWNVFHEVGTCPMGPNPDKGDVVDEEGRVYGIDSLRIADASIYPFTLPGHPQGQLAMIGEKISQIIIDTYPYDFDY